MNNKIKIDIVSDVVCPWCVIGYKRLEKAIDELNIKDKVEISWHPFELNPTMSKDGENFIEYFGKKYQFDLQKVKAFQNDMVKNGQDVGFTFDYFDEMRVYNTRDAHVMLDFAKVFEKQTELKLALFNAHFNERKNISNRDTLLDIVLSVGLDLALAIKVLENEDSVLKIEKEEYDWSQKGVTAVPTMVFNTQMAMNGAYPIETYKEVLTDLLQQNKELETKFK